jgi:hypothetical protein
MQTDPQTHPGHHESATALDRVLPPETGDPEIDTALDELAAVLDGPLERHFAVGVRCHHVLRGGLGYGGGA